MEFHVSSDAFPYIVTIQQNCLNRNQNKQVLTSINMVFFIPFIVYMMLDIDTHDKIDELIQQSQI